MEGDRLVVRGPSDAISRVRFAQRSNNLLISSWDTILRLYDADAASTRLEVRSEAALLDCCFVDEASALSAGSDCWIRRYDLPSGKHEKVGNHEDIVTAVEYSQETGQVISTGMDKQLILWDMRSKCRANEFIKMNAEVGSITLCHYSLVAAVRECVHVYDLRNMTAPLQSESSMDFQICCVRSFSNKKGYLAGSIDGRVALKFSEGSQSSKTGSVFLCHPKAKERRQHLVSVNDIASHPCQSTFVTGDNEGHVILWDAENKKRKFEFPKQSNSVASVSYNHNGLKLAIASSYTYTELEEMKHLPEIFLHDVDELGRPLLE
ncbi:transducin/WD40 repeat-like superfamily protein [Wolffia australiana]